jgi:hypothetical protein
MREDIETEEKALVIEQVGPRWIEVVIMMKTSLGPGIVGCGRKVA